MEPPHSEEDMHDISLDSKSSKSSSSSSSQSKTFQEPSEALPNDDFVDQTGFDQPETCKEEAKSPEAQISDPAFDVTQLYTFGVPAGAAMSPPQKVTDEIIHQDEPHFAANKDPVADFSKKSGTSASKPIAGQVTFPQGQTDHVKEDDTNENEALPVTRMDEKSSVKNSMASVHRPIGSDTKCTKMCTLL